MTPLCPEPLNWNVTAGFCTTPCPYPNFSADQYEGLRIWDGIIGAIGFVACWFFCMTSLFRLAIAGDQELVPTNTNPRIRPTLLKFPNSNLFFIHFSAGMVSLSFICSSILGNKVRCNDNITIANADNPLCVINS
jgi:hypothetical protein